MFEIDGHKFKTKPYDHQTHAWRESKDKIEYALFMDMGTGKSKVIIDTISYLYWAKKIDTVLIFSNKGSYRNWITSEFPAHLPEDIETHMTYWQASPNTDLMATYALFGYTIEALKIMVMNIEALAYKTPSELAISIVKSNKTFVVIDESTSIKNISAKRTKSAILIGRQALYRRILTGEPIANSPLDIWSQAMFLSPKLLRFASYFSFRSYYAKMVAINAGGRAFSKVVGYQNISELEANLKSWSYRIKKEDCLDLPPKVYQTYTIQMTDDQAKVYKQLKDESVAWLSAQSVISAPLAITKLLRLHQLACGHLSDDTKEGEIVFNNRIDALMEILEEVSGKAIIWATYRKNIDIIRKTITAKYGQEAIVTYFGDTSDADRAEALVKFQDPNNPCRFFLGNPKTGGYGLTLTAASTVIYYSNNYELEVRLQSEDRAHRIGQTKSVNYIDIVCEKTVDEKIIKALRSKKQISSAILGDEWKQWI